MLETLITVPGAPFFGSTFETWIFGANLVNLEMMKLPQN